MTDTRQENPEAVRLRERGLALVEAACAAGVITRVLGGIAVALRCPSARGAGPLSRDYSDIDLAVGRKHARELTGVLTECGYEAAERFNALHGDRRLLFAASDGAKVDVFIDEFFLCHQLPLARRLVIDSVTVSLADLLLTKLQVARLNEKDVTDVAALLLDCRLSEDESGINAPYVIRLFASDWGWWRTGTETIDQVERLLPSLALAQSERDDVGARLSELRQGIGEAPKTVRWRARARLGERRSWRIEPEDLGS